MILGGGVAVCLLLSAHRAVIFAIAQLSCFRQPPQQARTWCSNWMDSVWNRRRHVTRGGCSWAEVRIAPCRRSRRLVDRPRRRCRHPARRRRHTCTTNNDPQGPGKTRDFDAKPKNKDLVSIQQESFKQFVQSFKDQDQDQNLARTFTSDEQCI